MLVNRPLTIVSPDFPPKRGGVADHTQRLAQELSAIAQVTVVTSAAIVRRESTPAGLVIRNEVADWHDAGELKKLLATTEGPLLWQYVPHMYGRGGVNSDIPRILRALHSADRRQIVLAHEIAAPLSVWPHRLVYALCQRRQWRGILTAADAIGISTEAWLDKWRLEAVAVASNLILTPSPSNITVAAGSSRADWRRLNRIPADALVLTFFGSISRTKQFDWVIDAWREANRPDRPVVLCIVGGEFGAQHLGASADHVRAFGFQPPTEVSASLRATDVLALPFIDGVSERRCSFMAGLAHGCAVATTIGPGTGVSLRNAQFFRAVSARDRTEFIVATKRLLEMPDDRSMLGVRAVEAYRRDYDWPRLVETLGRLLWPAEPAIEADLK